MINDFKTKLGFPKINFIRSMDLPLWSSLTLIVFFLSCSGYA